MSRLKKIQCEICGDTDTKILHRHHIVERTEPNTSNDDMNLAIICPNCHSKIHSGSIEIVGIFPSTQQPYGRTLVFKKDGVSNVPGLNEPYYKPQARSMRIHAKASDKE
jgi:hypothetical protein